MGAVGDAPADAEPTLDWAAEPAPEFEASTAGSEELAGIARDLAAVGARFDALDRMGSQVAELTRLRTHDTAMIDRLHAEITRLRAGEIAQAFAPLLAGLVRLHDKMISLAEGDDDSSAGILRLQLLQLLDTAAGVQAYTPQPGDAFDTRRHLGTGRVLTPDASLDNTVARTLRPGFVRADSTVVRVAEVEVRRLDPAASAAAPAAPDVAPPEPADTTTPDSTISLDTAPTAAPAVD